MKRWLISIAIAFTGICLFLFISYCVWFSSKYHQTDIGKGIILISRPDGIFGYTRYVINLDTGIEQISQVDLFGGEVAIVYDNRREAVTNFYIYENGRFVNLALMDNGLVTYTDDFREELGQPYDKYHLGFSRAASIRSHLRNRFSGLLKNQPAQKEKNNPETGEAEIPKKIEVQKNIAPPPPI